MRMPDLVEQRIPEETLSENELKSKIRDSEQRLDTLLANLPGMAYRCNNDPAWTMEFVSEGAFDLTGYWPEELTGSGSVNYVSLIHPGDRTKVWTQIQAALDSDRSFTLEYRLIDAQGREKWVWEKGCGVAGGVIEGFISDITERKCYEEAAAEKTLLESRLYHLQKADSINRLAGSVAHHFNNKLHGVLASLELMEMSWKNGRFNPEALSIAISAAQQAAEVSQLMLDCLGQNNRSCSRVDLAALCKELQTELSADMPVSVRLDFQIPMFSLEVWADQEALRQIIKHLIYNAREGEGASLVEVRVLAVASEAVSAGTRNPVDWSPKDEQLALIEVADDGPGISETMIEQIFDPFFTTKFTGRGIGLALVLGLTRSHGGGVVVNSTPGSGTVLRVYLPLSPPQEIPPVAPCASSNNDVRNTSCHVLLVEDEAPVRRLAAMMLKSSGCHVLEAEDGQDALKILKKAKVAVDCVLADVRMPVLDGWGMLREIRQLMPDLPVILATAYNDAALSPEKDGLKPDAFIHKPYLLSDIKKVLDRICRKAAG